jgi:hypothetical protein
MAKELFAALFPPGFHEVSDDGIEAALLSVEPTPRRRQLASQLRLFVARLRQLGARGDLWVDGSLATRNPNPADIDVVLLISRVVLSAMSEDALHTLEEMSGEDGREYTRTRWGCDFYVISFSDLNRRIYFQDLFSRNPDNDSKKGILVIKV